MSLFQNKKFANNNGSNKKLTIALKDENKLVLALLGLASGLILMAVVMLVLVANNRVLATRGKVYIQMPDGTTKEAQEFDESHRENQVLEKTVIDFIRLTNEWDNKIPGSDQLDQKGTKIEGGKGVVPTKTYFASLLLEDGFRTEFLKAWSEVVPNDVYSGGRISIVKIYSISTPRQISTTRWEVDTVVSRIEKGTGNMGDKREVAFNRTYTLQAIVPSKLTLGEDETFVFRRHVNELLKNGVMIIKITPFTP